MNSTVIFGTQTTAAKSTITRIVGEVDVHVNTDDTDFLPTAGVNTRSWYTVNMGIQIVNREQAAGGTPRHPSIIDDREGGEWLWMRHMTFGWHTYTETATTTLTNWFVPMWNVGGYDPHFDIRVKRKLDLQQDDLHFSIAGVNCLDSIGMNFSCTFNARLLLMDT